MTTREVINGLPEHVRYKVETLRRAYTSYGDAYECANNVSCLFVMRQKEELRTLMRGYLMGLLHAGLITERMRQTLFVYMTVPKKEKEEETV